jgi:hypothetical protein
MNAEHIADAIKLTPTITVAATSVTGVVHWDTVSYILAAIYTALMIGNFMWVKLVKPYVKRKVSAAVNPPSGS